MNIDEQELRQRLAGVLEAVTPPPAPVSATLRRGRSMRARRRIGVAAGLAVAVGLAVALPGLLHPAAQTPVAPARPSVTVNPADPIAPGGVIGSGTINGKRWQLIAQKPGADGMPKNTQCFLVSGAVSEVQGCVPVPLSTGGGEDLVAFASLSGGRAQAQYGVVARAVTRVTVSLADGTRLVLYSTEAYGQRYVAFAVPLPLAISQVVAYAGHAELGYAVPFNTASGTWITIWLRPGQRGLPRAAYRIGSGSVDGKSWSEAVHVGPWGYCFTGPQEGCFDTESRTFGDQVATITGDEATTPQYAVGTASAAVSYVRATLSDRSVVTARAFDAGGPRFFAFAIPKGVKLVKVAYYAASGRQLASQSASQIG
jgi:hypothetical protein